jgi:hypothetical protein
MLTVHVTNCIIHSDIIRAVQTKEKIERRLTTIISLWTTPLHHHNRLSLASCMEKYIIIDPLE